MSCAAGLSGAGDVGIEKMTRSFMRTGSPRLVSEVPSVRKMRKNCVSSATTVSAAGHPDVADTGGADHKMHATDRTPM